MSNLLYKNIFFVFSECFKHTASRFGGLDIVINNAGIADEWRRPFQVTVDINLVSEEIFIFGCFQVFG